MLCLHQCDHSVYPTAHHRQIRHYQRTAVHFPSPKRLGQESCPPSPASVNCWTRLPFHLLPPKNIWQRSFQFAMMPTRISLKKVHTFCLIYLSLSLRPPSGFFASTADFGGWVCVVVTSQELLCNVGCWKQAGRDRRL